MKEPDIKRFDNDQNNEYEECALCHRLTEVRLDMPIDCRQHYVYGVGQLCEKCYHKTYCEAGE